MSVGQAGRDRDHRIGGPGGARTGALVCGLVLLSLASGAAVAAARKAGPKYYFQLREVKAGPEVDPGIKAWAGDALKADLASRAEWASDVGVEGSDALVAALKSRNLRGFDVTLRMDRVDKQLKDPNPGSRLKRLAITVRLSVVGTTIPESKLAFSGDGQAGLEAEVSEKQMQAEEASLTKDVVKDAVKQAVDAAVLKLGASKASAPLNESRRRRQKPKAAGDGTALEK